MPLRSAPRQTPPKKDSTNLLRKKQKIFTFIFFDFFTLKFALFYNSQNRICLARFTSPVQTTVLCAIISHEEINVCDIYSPHEVD